MNLKIELDREDDGRWIGEVPELAGVMVYGMTREEALAKVEALALRVIADRLEHCESPAGRNYRETPDSEDSRTLDW